MKGCGDVAFSYREVETGLLGGGNLPQMPRYISWDNVIDMFLTRQPIAPTYHVVSSSQQAPASQIMMTEESMVSAEVNLRDEEESVGGQARVNRNPPTVPTAQAQPVPQRAGNSGSKKG